MNEKQVQLLVKETIRFMGDDVYPRIKQIDNQWYLVLTKVSDNIMKTVYRLNEKTLLFDYLGFQCDDALDRTYPNGVDFDTFNNVLWQVMETKDF
jgi:hypothetical protein